MCWETYIGITIFRWLIVGYLAYRLAAKVNWPLAWYYMRGGK